ncbi:hypothetical protein ACFFX1_11220 [Dactylosporangium sucinum]|uniref:Uncharacterized protein n=1 Tax=Dactylosporangium sucinum TaxID=1424081 RepID=A0A917WR99_9ACTN|nr:hypothetical protein [Dactylosporangium sucinum]GGM22292.1 hypothetical protein GCM10007977_024330 [Dactylosporangium sucinum]
MGLEGVVGLIFVVVVCCYAVKTAVADSVYAIRGQTPPRVKLRMAELQKTGKARYSFWDYLGDLFQHALEERRKVRDARRADPLAGRGPLRRFLSKWWAKQWEEAWDAWLDRQEKKEQAKADRAERRRSKPAEGDPIDDDAPLWRRWSAGVGNWFRKLFKVDVDRDGDGGAVDDDTEYQGPQASQGPSGGPQQPAPTGSGRGGPPPENAVPQRPAPRPAATPQPGDQPLATVIPMFKEESTMSDAPEVTGLGTATQYAGGMAQAHASSVAATEQFVANLQGNGVSGEVISAATAAQEASNAAAAAWDRANQVLTQHSQVKEAYDANPGAGSKEFVTAE